MAIECLILNQDQVNPNLPQSSLLRRGDFISIKDDSQGQIPWGNKEDPRIAGTKFWIVRIEGVDLSDPRVNAYLEQNGYTVDEDGPHWISRRTKFLNIDALPANRRNDLNNDGYTQVRANQLASWDSAIQDRA